VKFTDSKRTIKMENVIVNLRSYRLRVKLVHHLFENNFGGTEARSLLIAAIFFRKLMGVVPEC